MDLSLLPSEADIRADLQHFCIVPIAEVARLLRRRRWSTDDPSRGNEIRDSALPPEGAFLRRLRTRRMTSVARQSSCRISPTISSSSLISGRGLKQC